MYLPQTSALFAFLAFVVPYIEACECNFSDEHEVDLSEPAFGPDGDRPLDVSETVEVCVPAGGAATFTFSSEADNENAIVVYSAKNYDELHAANSGDQPFEAWTFENESHDERCLVVTGWHKDAPPGSDLEWKQSAIGVETQSPTLVVAGFEDDVDMDFNDIAFVAQIHAGDVLFEETWDAENGGVGVYGYDSFERWDVTVGDVDLVGNGFDDYYPGRGLYLDLDGFAGIPGGRLETKAKFLLEPGAYKLEVDLGGGARSDENNSVTISLGMVFSETFGPFPGVLDVPSDMTTFVRIIEVDEEELARLIVDHAIFSPEGDDDGPYLDVIRLSRVQDSD